ncbi:plasmid recombination protein [uncultured Roseobacter sp.]|uniref:plasmid recombination protein n=1 Tax=uncultured Roseobacter sp. TaxID=114847 RepID=UPI00261060DA|nr:plasmid recombination protein [uncultured Roseobacter sp.]
MSSAGSARGVGRTTGQVAGDNDHELREGHIPDYVDENRSYLNTVIVHPSTGSELWKKCNALRSQRETKRAMKSNACIAQSIMISFGHGIQDDFKALDIELQNELYLKLMQRIALEANTEISGLVAHRDETAPHAHGQLVGYNRDGTPLTKIMTRQFRKDMQDWMLEIFQPHITQMERGVAKSVRLARGEKAATTINRSVAELHKDLPKEIAAKKGVLDDLLAKIAKNERLAEKARLKAIDDGDQADKAVKRAETYGRRAKAARETMTAAEVELASLESKLAGMRNEEALLNDELKRVDGEVAVSLETLAELETATAQKKTNIDRLRKKKAHLNARLQSLSVA